MDKALQIQREVQEILGTDEVYLVGGSVRDIIMGHEAHDYDFTTSMIPEDMIEKIKLAGRHAYTIGEKFGTIGFKVPIEDKMDLTWLGVGDLSKTKYEYVEVTTFRSEVYTGKSRKPEVQFVPSLDEDLARRDFTMNAMVLRSDGSIYDPYGGRLDIYAKQIKTVGLPKDRIIEDPLRMFRAARFAARYNFKIDPNFTGKARQLADRIFDVSVERWVMELDKLLTSNYVYSGIEELHKMGVLQRVLPELYFDDNDMQKDVYTNPFDCHGDMKTYESADIAWKFLLSNVHTPDSIKESTRTRRYISRGIISRLKFSNDRTKIILGDKK